jgi:hypothetical protein
MEAEKTTSEFAHRRRKAANKRRRMNRSIIVSGREERLSEDGLFWAESAPRKATSGREHSLRLMKV